MCLVPNAGSISVPVVGEITVMLSRMREGDEHAASELIRIVYGELHALAAAKMAREVAGHKLQPTALVHEAWLRLGGDAQPGWKNRPQFFAGSFWC